MAIAPSFAQLLKTEASYIGVTATSIWGDRAVDAPIISPLKLAAHAVTEGTRQAVFLAGPIVVDRLTLKGRRRDLMGKAIYPVADRFGYDGTVPAFVISVQELEGGVSAVSVVRRLT